MINTTLFEDYKAFFIETLFPGENIQEHIEEINHLSNHCEAIAYQYVIKVVAREIIEAFSNKKNIKETDSPTEEIITDPETTRQKVSELYGNR